MLIPLEQCDGPSLGVFKLSYNDNDLTIGLAVL